MNMLARSLWPAAICLPVLAGCGSESTQTDDAAIADTRTDATAADVRDADEADATDLSETDPVPPGGASPLPETSVLDDRRGFRVARGIVHSHTVFSHDACDREPRDADGTLNDECLQDWREGVCETRMDVVFNTDHDEFAAEVPYEDLLLQRGEDELVRVDGEPVANRMKCENGQRVLVLPGFEAGLMPVGVKRHLDATPEERLSMYGDTSPERVQSFREAGGVVLQAHTESESRETLRELELDGFEIYNLHANVAPDIREEHLGLDPGAVLDQLQPFIGDTGPHPDLAMIAFFEPNQPALESFDTLLAEGQKLVGTAGNDAHRNALDIPLRDDERADSFRRMMKFFSHHFLVEERSPEAFREALRRGRTYAAFEYLGTPVGFDFRIEAGGETVEMGGTASLADDPELRVRAPSVYARGVEADPEIELIRAETGGGETVARERGDLTHTPAEPGAYRVVVRVLPEYLRPYLGENPDQFLDEPVVWIYSNPVYIES